MKRRRGLIVLLTVAVTVGVALIASRSREPKYQGKPLSKWFWELQELPLEIQARGEIKPDLAENSPARAKLQALRALAPASVHFLVRMLQTEDSGLKRLYSRLHEKLPQPILQMLPAATPASQITWASEVALISFGQEAQPAVPGLIAALRHRSPDVRRAAALVLASIGPAAREAIPALIRALEDRNDPGPISVIVRSQNVDRIVQFGDQSDSVPINAIRALTRIGEKAQIMAPLLNCASNAAYVHVRQAAILALDEFGAGPVPGLIGLLGDSNPRIKGEAIQVLGKIGVDASAAVPRLAEAVDDESFFVRNGAIYALQRMGPAAKSAIPALRRAFSDPDLSIRVAASNALERIAPEAAKAGL